LQKNLKVGDPKKILNRAEESFSKTSENYREQSKASPELAKEQPGAKKTSLTLGWGFLPILFLKTLHPSFRIDQLLFASEKGVALGANLHLHAGTCRFGMNRFPAGTDNRAVLIGGMNLLFHRRSLSSLAVV
jgi:hypothetical protein